MINIKISLIYGLFPYPDREIPGNEPGNQPATIPATDLPCQAQGYGRGNGDMVVNISVYVPKTLSQKEKKALEEMRESDNFKGDSATKRTIFQKFRNYFS